jgi:putative FmdB family regulatory protein
MGCFPASPSPQHHPGPADHTSASPNAPAMITSRQAGTASRTILAVPRYEYRCRACGSTFERSRPMSESSAPCRCPNGHDDTVKLLSTVSVGGRAGAAESRGSGGGCCGGACGCR